MRNFLLFLVICLFHVSPVGAQSSNQFITVVNPVRISAYNPDPVASIKAQYGVIYKYNLPATWLVTYDVLDNQDLVQELKSFGNGQEMGVFLEVTPDFAKAAKVLYNNSGSWHYSNSVLFSGYSQADRLKLIDTVFNKFKNQFGYYPTSIGSWWTDAYSLGVIKEKYSVTANLGVSDQFKTDGYQVWGQYWSTPFYPSKKYPAQPAGSLENKLDLVTIQWAPRDPYWGYLDSLYSTQDYFTAPKQNIDYYAKLLYLYASKHDNKFGQITVGLEGDYSANSYSGIFSQQMNEVKKLVSTGNYSAVTMSQFSNWYRNEFPKLSPEHLIVSDDLLGGNIQATWFQSPQYRIGLFRDKSKGITRLIDLRVYSDLLVDPYFSFVNGNRNLFINVPSSVDMISKPGSEVVLDSEEVNFDQIVEKYSKKLPQQIVFNDYSLKIPYAFRSRLGNISNNASVFMLIGISALAFWFFKPSRIIIVISLSIYFIYFSQISYFVSLYEVDALKYLESLPPGNVMVYDKDCLRCVWTTSNQPAALANKRNYVEKISKHMLVYNSSFLLAADGGQGKLILKNNKIVYLYLVKYGNYEENTHFSPLDLNISKIYENANAAIYKFNEGSY